MTAAPQKRSETPVADGVSGVSGLYRLLVDSVRDYGIVALDPEGHILSWNRGAERIKGYTAKEIIGKHFSIFYPREDVERGKTDEELRVTALEGRFEDEGWRIRKDGSRFWANVVITALRDETNELVGFARVTRDLTERRRTEETLRASEERVRLLVQSVKDYAIFMLDPSGRIATWNEGAQRIKGYTQSEIVGKHFSIFYPEEDLANGKPAYELEVAIEVGRFEDEGWRLKKDGSRFWANVIITRLTDPTTGQLVGFAKVTRDLTERRRAEERAIEDARKLAAAEAASSTKSQFLATLSHELRTPLNAVAGYAELIGLGVAGPVSDKQIEYVERIRSAQQHLLAIIDDLLNYSRVEAGQIALNLAPVHLRSAVDRAVRLVQPQAASKDIALDLSGCDQTIVAIADQGRVDQIVLNLLSNAVKFTTASGQVIVSCSQAGEIVQITVRDTGPGIPPAKREAVFEPFVQLGRSLTSAHEGTGLGLAISRNLARAMDGDVFVEDSDGPGAVFTLTLRAG